MSAATDRAQFYIEQLVPELRELEAKQIFSKTEIRAIVKQRRDFEHKLNAPGATPVDAVRYIVYEINLNEMRLLRAKRMGSKIAKHSGARRMFPLLERMNRKFPGDISLWMRYIDYAKKQKAYKRIRKAFADMLRLHPQKTELWVLAARYEFEEEGDITEAESYMQRGLRISPKSRDLYIEFFRLMLDSLAKIEDKSRKMGLHKAPSEVLIAAANDDTSGDLPKINGDFTQLPDVEEDAVDVDVDPKVVEALEKTRVAHERIAVAIFDSAMKQSEKPGDVTLASDMFELSSEYEIPSRTAFLTHMYDYMRERDMAHPATRNAALRMPLIGLDVNTPEFAMSLATVLNELLRSLAESSPAARRLHILTARWLHRYLLTENIDEGIGSALASTLTRIFASYRSMIGDKTGTSWESRLANPHEETLELLEFGRSMGENSQVLLLHEAASERWPGRIPSLEVMKIS